jgi:hypothetical protein
MQDHNGHYTRHKGHKEKIVVSFVVLRDLRDPYFCTNVLEWKCRVTATLLEFKSQCQPYIDKHHIRQL